MTTEPWMGDACSLVDAYRAGTISPTEALEGSLAAIADSKLNALCFVDEEKAREAAASADVQLPFGGVPIGVKELDPVKGWPQTEGPTSTTPSRCSESRGGGRARPTGPAGQAGGRLGRPRLAQPEPAPCCLHGQTWPLMGPP
jgi:Amidase